MSEGSTNTPKWWFKPIQALVGITEEPMAIEYLRMPSGETFIHVGGTAYWNGEKFVIELLYLAGVTHWRMRENVV